MHNIGVMPLLANFDNTPLDSLTTHSIYLADSTPTFETAPNLDRICTIYPPSKDSVST